MSSIPGLSPKGEPTSFEGCLSRVNPSAESLQNLSEQPDETPILMLNLLRFRPRGDSFIYSLYGKEAAPEVNKVGSFIGYFGKVLADFDPAFGFDDTWDGVVIPVYHRRGSYLKLQASPVYQLAIPYRSAGTSRRMLYPLCDGEKIYDDTPTISYLDRERVGLDARQGEVYLVDILRFSKADGDSVAGKRAFKRYAQSVRPLLAQVGACPVLSVNPEVPVLSEEVWDHVIVTRFPSAEAVAQLYGSDAWKASLPARSASLESSISVATAAVPLPK